MEVTMTVREQILEKISFDKSNLKKAATVEEICWFYQKKGCHYCPVQYSGVKQCEGNLDEEVING